MNHLNHFNKTSNFNGIPKSDTIHINRSGLAFDVNIDWQLTSFIDNESEDGILVFVAQLASPLSVPIPIPSNVEGMITLAPPKQMHEKLQCRPNDQLPELYFYDYYDPFGSNCLLDQVGDI